MTHATEKLDVMDAITTFGKQKQISVSKCFALSLCVLFVGCVVTTGLLVYYLSPKAADQVKFECNCSRSVVVTTEKSADAETADTETTAVEITTTESSQSTADELNPRLPRSVIPHSYKLYIIPFVFEGNFTFHGNATILVNVTEITNNITLHADELGIDANSLQVLKVSDNFTSPINVRDISNDSKLQFFVIHFEEELEAGSQYEIKMTYDGVLNDVLQGFYRSSYTVNNTKRWIAATQFQPTDARKAFPCFDEPALKATFQMNLGRFGNMSSISNMPKIKTSSVDGLDNYVWDHFQESVPMSTYLVAFVVSDFAHVTNGSLSIWSRSSAINQAKFSLKIGPQILEFYENFFQIKFPLPKIDMVALPDFSTGAMENWGLITYRESVLLYEEGVSTVSNLQSIAIVVAHELAHQWFGNLVTPLWWTDLWLNEGFASYLEYLGTDAACPELKLLDQFVVQELQNVFHLDALKSSHQISIVVNNPAEINNIFDRISYGKGATIIRMMEHFLTSDVFKKGLSTFLNSRKYSNAEQDDLWSALTHQAHQDNVFGDDMTVKEIMDTWTLQTGFPVVTVTRNYDENSAIFSQERFLVGEDKNTSYVPMWWIPITYQLRNGKTLDKIWLKAQPEIKVFLNGTAKDWILLNINQTGYFRVNYDSKNWQLIIQELNSENGFQKFDPKNRAQLLDDALNLASAGYLNYDTALNVTRYLIHEREYVPWKSAFIEFDFLYQIFSRSGQFDKFKTYVLHLIRGLYRDIGFNESPNDPMLKIYTRMDMLWRACLFGYRDCILNAVKEFQKWRNSPDPDNINPISPNLRSVVYCHAIKVGGQEEWDFAWERYLNTDVGSEKELIMSGLGCSTETWILTRYLEWAITEGAGIRKQDSVRVFASVSSSVIGQQLTYKFLKINWENIKKYMGSSVMLLIGIIRESIISYPSEHEIADIKAFVASKGEDMAFASRVIQQLIEQGEANLDWKNRHFNDIVNWLSLVDTSS